MSSTRAARYMRMPVLIVLPLPAAHDAVAMAVARTRTCAITWQVHLHVRPLAKEHASLADTKLQPSKEVCVSVWVVWAEDGSV